MLNKLKEVTAKTTERPYVLESDVLARYHFASLSCKGKKILDVGTGLGIGAKYLLDHGAKEVVGIDYSNSAIHLADKNVESRLKFKVLNGMEVDKLKDKFDVILAFEVIEHLPLDQVGVFLKKISQRLNPGGTLVITTPNGLKTKYILGKPYNPFHVKEYTGGEIERLLNNEFSDINLQGMTLVNKSYKGIQKELESSFASTIISFLGHFKLVRLVLAFLPSGLKRRVTGEGNLPKLGISDFKLDRNWLRCEGLYVTAKKSKKQNKTPYVLVIVPNY